jgi:hypothetical protein
LEAKQRPAEEKVRVKKEKEHGLRENIRFTIKNLNSPPVNQEVDEGAK